MASKERALYSSRLTTPGRSSSSQDTSSEYGRVVHNNFHFADNQNGLYSHGRRSALDDLNPINKPLVSLDVHIDVSFFLSLLFSSQSY